HCTVPPVLATGRIAHLDTAEERCDAGFCATYDRSGSFASVERYPWHVCFTLDSGRIAHCREPT
ncbi:MAG: hypothetical protein WA754_18495, partial [Pseudolabrys sp.]